MYYVLEYIWDNTNASICHICIWGVFFFRVKVINEYIAWVTTVIVCMSAYLRSLTSHGTHW